MLSRSSVQIKLNQNAIRKVVEQAKQQYAHAWQTIHDDVWRTHAGQPREHVRAAIKAHQTTRKLKSSDVMIDRVAEAIATRQRMTFN